MDPYKRLVTIEMVTTADEIVVGGRRFGTDTAGYRTILAKVAVPPPPSATQERGVTPLQSQTRTAGEASGTCAGFKHFEAQQRSSPKQDNAKAHGPCYDAVQTEPFVLSKHLVEDERWPRYSSMAADLGIASHMSTVLVITCASRAALNLYSSRVDGFDELDDAEQFAFHAGLILEDSEHLRHLDTAQGSRTVIGQATGIVMERFSMDRDAAFGHLVRVSQTTNVKLRRVAQRIVEDTERR